MIYFLSKANRFRVAMARALCVSSVAIVLQALVLTIPCQAAKPHVPAPPRTPLYTYDLTPVSQYNLDTPAGKNNAWAEVQAVAALQGLVNRSAPRLYLYYVSDDPKQPGRIDRFWLTRMQENNGWLAKKPLQPIGTLEALITKFRTSFRGVVLYDLTVPATSNVASTVAGCDNLLPIPYDLTPGSVYDRLVVHGPKLPIKMRLLNVDGTPMFTGAETGSAKCDAYLWAKRKYLDTGKCNPTLLGYCIDSWWRTIPHNDVPEGHRLANHDYLIAHRAFFFDLSPWEDETPQDDPKQPLGADHKTLLAILLSAYNATKGKHMICVMGFVPWPQKYTSYTGGHHEPVASEWHFAAIISCFNTYMNAVTNAMANGSVFCQFPQKRHYPQNKPTLADWKKAGYVDAQGKVIPRTYVSFYVGDYDSDSWIYRYLPNFWTDPARGSIPLSWGFNPNLAVSFPVGLDWMRRTATPNDHFISGDSGAGYINPGNLDGDRPFSHLPSGVAVWTQHNAQYYRQWDITLTGFVINGEARPMSPDALAAYAKFSPDGIIGQAQNLPSPAALVPATKTPYLDIGYDLAIPFEANESMRRIQAQFTPDTSDTPQFHIYRTVLWSPSQHRELIERLKALPNVTVVDAYTLMGLLRLKLSAH